MNEKNICPICFDDFNIDLEDGLYFSKQCENHLHYTCEECAISWKENQFRLKKNYTCVICKNIIEKYDNINNDVLEISLPENTNTNITLSELNHNINRLIESNNRRTTITYQPFLIGIQIIFIFILLLLSGSYNTKDFIFKFFIFINIILFFINLSYCCSTTQNINIIPIR